MSGKSAKPKPSVDEAEEDGERHADGEDERHVQHPGHEAAGGNAGVEPAVELGVGQAGQRAGMGIGRASGLLEAFVAA